MTVMKCNDGMLLPTLQYDCVMKCNDGMLLPTLQYDCVMKCNDGMLLPTLQYDCVMKCNDGVLLPTLQYSDYEQVVVEDRIEKEKARRKAELETEQLKCAVKVRTLNELTAMLNIRTTHS